MKLENVTMFTMYVIHFLKMFYYNTPFRLKSMFGTISEEYIFKIKVGHKNLSKGEKN